MLGKKAKCEQYKYVVCCFKQILETAVYKTAAAWPLISHLTNHPNKMNKNKLIRQILLWTPAHGHTNADWPAKTSIHQFYVDTGYHLEDLLGAMTS